jgi:hypothetical protein
LLVYWLTRFAQFAQFRLPDARVTEYRLPNTDYRVAGCWFTPFGRELASLSSGYLMRELPNTDYRILITGLLVNWFTPFGRELASLSSGYLMRELPNTDYRILITGLLVTGLLPSVVNSPG